MEKRELFQFPAWTNKILTLLGGVGTIAVIYIGLIVNYGASPKTINAGYAPLQEIPFSHKLHAGELKLDCRYCHNTVEKAAHAAIPPTGTCLNCHTGADGRLRRLAFAEVSSVLMLYCRAALSQNGYGLQPKCLQTATTNATT
ncbi:MAG: hypothetical protein CMJ46_05490, partial [Planctomyces sp.]|nr:hypothetical protein [Planctomyces sp.]